MEAEDEMRRGMKAGDGWTGVRNISKQSNGSNGLNGWRLRWVGQGGRA